MSGGASTNRRRRRWWRRLGAAGVGAVLGWQAAGLAGVGSPARLTPGDPTEAADPAVPEAAEREADDPPPPTTPQAGRAAGD